MKLEDLKFDNQLGIDHTINATPDADYPLRILRTYRKMCNTRVSDNLDGQPNKNPLLDLMNEVQGKRADILDKAITVLEGHKIEVIE